MFAAHCSRRGAAPCAPMGAKIGSLDAPENCPHFAATRARVRALRAARPRMARPCRGVGVAIALQPTWRGSPRADCGENRLVGCAGELPTFCRPARPSARPVSRAAAYGATLPLRRRRAAETRDQAPSPAPPTLHRARRARPVSGPSFGASDPAPRCSAPSAGPPVHRSGLAARAGS